MKNKFTHLRNNIATVHICINGVFLKKSYFEANCMVELRTKGHNLPWGVIRKGSKSHKLTVKKRPMRVLSRMSGYAFDNILKSKKVAKANDIFIAARMKERLAAY